MNPFKTELKEHRGHTIRIEWHYDESVGPPWEYHRDSHGPVRPSRTNDKRPGERPLGEGYWYDWQTAIQTARKEWDLCDNDKQALAARLGKPADTLTAGEIAVEAVRRDYEYLREWYNDEWHWCGYTVTITDPEGAETDGESLWGIASTDTDEMEGEAFANAVADLDRELSGQFDYACRC